MLAPSVVGIERALRQVRQAPGEGYGLTAGRSAEGREARASGIATTTTAVSAFRLSEGGEEEAFHGRQGGYTGRQVFGTCEKVPGILRISGTSIYYQYYGGP